MTFSYDGSALGTCAPDGRALVWDTSAVLPDGAPAGEVRSLPQPVEVARPAFRLFNLLGGKKQPARGKKRDLSAQWRCVAMPAGLPPRAARGAPSPLFAALNHPGGPGWLARADSRTGRVRAYAKACNAMVPAIAVSDDAKLVVAGNSEGELLAFDGASLTRLLRVAPHELFITSLMLRESAPSGLGALTGGVSYTAITCCGDNSVKLTPLPPHALKKRTSYTPLLGLSLCVLLLSWLLQHFPALQSLLLPSAVQPLAASLFGGDMGAAQAAAQAHEMPTVTDAAAADVGAMG